MFGRMKDPAQGTATVVGYSEHHEQKGNEVVLDAQVMVQAEGLVPTTVDVKPSVPASWMPVKVGTVWPVRVDRSKPERIEFLFDQVRGQAPPPVPQAPAPQMPAAPYASFSLPPSIQVMGGSMEQAKEAIEMAEQMMGMDLDADGKVAGGPAPAGGSPFATFFPPGMAIPGAAQSPAPAPADDDDPVSRLERLAKLLDEGAITREEFDAQKKRILGSA